MGAVQSSGVRRGGEVGGGGWGGGKRPAPQTPLKQKHPFSSENKPPSQDLHEQATSAGRGGSNEGQDVPLRTHLRRAEGQKPVYIDPPSVSLPLSSFTVLPWLRSYSGSWKIIKKIKAGLQRLLAHFIPSHHPLTELPPARQQGRAWSCIQQTKTEGQRLSMIKEQLRCYERLICSLCGKIIRKWVEKSLWLVFPAHF